MSILILILMAILLNSFMMVKSKNIWEKVVPLLALSTKISLFLLVFSFINKDKFLYDVGILYLLFGTGGGLIIASFLARSDME
ncbi:hypothetical protein JYK00_07630 [Thermosipho ferrireducens]|uniref:PH regulation protein F n=1 Tax=Thermosipho ferrireducens TaxID=2571116 RepID=A0ABX7S524_9BACT|nr:hypothetical protein [Thermosipho ferrireducens]QTA37594.1 hypothetical protein JYK00_07630 [Thermosipho ferrireducens]